MKFFTGFALGAASVLVLPLVAWSNASPYFRSLRNSVNDGLETIKSYAPSELKKKKQEEIKQEKEARSPIKFEITDESKNQKKKLSFFTELQQNMNELQILSNHRALNKQEKILIIRKGLKKHFPEYYPSNQTEVKDEKI